MIQIDCKKYTEEECMALLKDSARLRSIAMICNMKLTHAEISGLILTAITFKDCNFFQSNFTRNDLKYAAFEGCQLISTGFKGEDLTHCEFRECYCAQTDFSTANLSYAKFPDTEMRYCILGGANLSRACFSSVVEHQCDFTAAELHYTNLPLSVLEREKAKEEEKASLEKLKKGLLIISILLFLLILLSGCTRMT